MWRPRFPLNGIKKHLTHGMCVFSMLRNKKGVGVEDVGGGGGGGVGGGGGGRSPISLVYVS